ncbi:hypothetical protein SUGI_0809020 [Cryptomeria japonica]|nr:hypothetical protein SUGI_0809020 [Cryptomeria japonica]
MMALYLAKLAYSKSTYRYLYSLRITFSFNSANVTIPFDVKTTLPFVGYKCATPPRSVEMSPRELMSFYKDMSTMRHMEIATNFLYRSSLVRGFVSFA